jgi:hypothetical protein
MENLRQEKGQGAGHAPSGEPVTKGAPQLAGAINQSELAAAMHFLGQTLGAASHYDPSRPDHGRASVVAALVGVNQLIAALFPNKPALPVPLIDLACALKDLDRGIVGPLLQPTEISHRPPKALLDDLFTALPAAAMTLLMTAGTKREDAGREIARHLERMGYRHASGDRISASQIAKWRERMMTERAAENLAVARYQLALEQVKGQDAAAAANFILANIPALYPPQIPKKPTS